MASADTIYKEKIDVFYGGMPDDIRIQKPELSFISQHLDTWINPKRLTPYRNMVEDQNTAYEIILFAYANSILYGLGIKTGAQAKIYQKATDPITGSWAASTSGEAGGGSRSTTTFIPYHNYLYGGRTSTGSVWAYGDLTGTPSFTDSAYTGAGIPTAQGIVTSDDLLLLPCSNMIAKKDGAGSGPTTNWSVGITIPSDYTIADLEEWGDQVAIFARPVNTSLFGQTSKIFLWDKVNPDPTQVIDLGEGDVYIGANLEGVLVAVLSVGASTSFSLKDRLIVRQWTGGSQASVVKEIAADPGVSHLVIYGNHAKVKDGNRIVFAMKIVLDGVTYNQLFAIGRKTSAYPLALQGDRLVDNDTALTGNIQGIGKLGGYYFISHNQDGSVNRTNDQVAYTNATGAYITAKLNGESKVQDSARRRKVLKMAGLLTAPLTTGQSVSLYYRTDSNSSWTLIRTYAYGDDAAAVPTLIPANMGFEAGKQNDGADFQNYKEMQFKGTATGGAEITAFLWAWGFAGADTVSE